MPQDTPSRKLDQYIVRFPDGMRDQLKAKAKASGRSLNAEIVWRLGESLDADAEEEGYVTTVTTFPPESFHIDELKALLNRVNSDVEKINRLVEDGDNSKKE